MINKMIMEHFGLEYGEEFMIGSSKYRFIEELEIKTDSVGWVTSTLPYNYLMEAKIEKIPFKPKCMCEFWYVSKDGSVEITLNIEHEVHLGLIYVGNCYRTRDEALKDVGKWKVFYCRIMSGEINHKVEVK